MQQLSVDGADLLERAAILPAPLHQRLELINLVVGNDLDMPAAVNAVGQRPHWMGFA